MLELFWHALCIFLGRQVLDTPARVLTGHCPRQAIARDTLASEDAGAHRRFGFYRTPAATNGAARRANGLGMRIAIDIARGLAYLHSRKARRSSALGCLHACKLMPVSLSPGHACGTGAVRLLTVSLGVRQIIHMDMKSANILLARDMTAKIAVRCHAHVHQLDHEGCMAHLYQCSTMPSTHATHTHGHRGPCVIQDVGLARILKREYLTTLQGSAFTFAYAAPEVRELMPLRAHPRHSRAAPSQETLELGAVWQVLLGRECSTAVDCYGLGARPLHGIQGACRHVPSTSVLSAVHSASHDVLARVQALSTGSWRLGRVQTGAVCAG